LRAPGNCDVNALSISFYHGGSLLILFEAGGLIAFTSFLSQLSTERAPFKKQEINKFLYSPRIFRPVDPTQINSAHYSISSVGRQMSTTRPTLANANAIGRSFDETHRSELKRRFWLDHQGKLPPLEQLQWAPEEWWY